MAGQTVREFITKLGYRVDDTGLRKYNNQLKGIQRNTSMMLNDIRSYLGVFGGVFAITKLRDVADETQSLEARIAQLPQTTGKAADSFNAVVNAAIAARQPFEEFGSLYTRIGHVSQDIIPTQEKLIELVSTISKSFVVGGTKAREQAAAMMQLSQAFNKGKLDGDEFRTVIEAMPGQITRALAKKMGYDSMALFETARENGELTIEKLVKGFKELNTYVNNQFKQMPMTISQGLTIVGNRFALFLAKLNRESGVVTEIANAIIKGFDLIGEGWERVVKFFGGNRQVWRAAKLLFGTWLAPKLLRGVGKAIAFIGKRAFWVATAFISLVAAGEDFYTWLQGGKSVFGDYFGTLDEFTKKYQNITHLIKSLKNAFINAGTAMKQFFEDMKTKIFGEKDVEKGIKGWIQGSLGWIDEKIGDLRKGEGFGGSIFKSPQEFNKQYSGTQNNTYNIMVSGHDPANGKEIGRQIRTEVQKIKLPGVADMMMGGHVR